MKNSLTFLLKKVALFCIIFLLCYSFSPVIGQDTISGYTMADTVLAAQYEQQANELMNAGKYNEALSIANESLAIKLATYGDTHLSSGDTYNTIGMISSKQGLYEQAIHNFNEALSIFLTKKEDNSIRVARVYYNLGIIARRKSLYSEALNYYEKTLEIMTILDIKDLTVANLYNVIAVVHHNKNDYDEAVYYYNKAINLMKTLFDGDHIQVASVYNNLGLVYIEKGNIVPALQCLQNALNIKKSIKGIEHPNTANTLNNIGQAYNLKGDFDQAIIYYEKALNIKSRVYGDNHPSVARTLCNIGLTCNSTGSYDKGIHYLERALQISISRLGNESMLTAQICNGLGSLQEAKGLYNQSLSSYQKALSIKEAILGENNISTARTYNNIGSIYFYKEDFDQALLYLKKALEVKINTMGEKHPSLVNTLNNIGLVYLEQEKYEQSSEYFYNAREISKEGLSEKHPQTIYSQLHIIDLYQSQLNLDSSWHHIEEVLLKLDYNRNKKDDFSQVNHLIPLRKILRLITNQFQLLYAQTQLTPYKDSLLCYQKAQIELEEHLQLKHTNPDTRQFYSSTAIPIYEGALETLLQFDEPEKKHEAWTLSEKTKSRQLTEKIQAESFTTDFGLPDSLHQQEYELEVDIAYYEKKKFQETYEKKPPNDSLIQGYQNQIFDLREQRAALLNRFKEAYPTYYNARYNVDVVSVTEVQQSLSAEQSLVEYFVGDSTIYLFLVQPDHYEIHSIKKDFPLDTLVENLRQGLYEYYSISEDDQTDQLYTRLHQQYKNAARQLYQKLVSPIADKLTEELVVIPDGVLGYIPFEALLTADISDEYNYNSYPFLLKDHSISYAYSATLLHEMQKKQHKQKPTKALLAMAPFFANGYAQTRNIISRAVITDTTTTAAGVHLTNQFNPLLNSGLEVKEVAKTWDGDYYINEQATEKLFSDSSSIYRMLHLATHGQADYRYGDYSFLAFSQIADSIENEFLYVSDIYGLRLNADLVVLSACNTGVGELKRGEGIVSLARAFAYAGAKSMVTTLWVADDAATKDLMIGFHHNLKSGMTKDAALQQAKIHYIDRQKDSDLGHPYFWASFFASGDMSRLEE